MGASRVLLDNNETALGQRYRAYVDYLATTVRPVFWDSVGSGLRCVSLIGNLSLSPFDPAQK